MGMSVPDCPEWEAQRTFRRVPCTCCASDGKPHADCSACQGGGTVGTVAIEIYAARKNDLPPFTGDPRYDPRADAAPRWLGGQPPDLRNAPLAKPAAPPGVRHEFYLVVIAVGCVGFLAGTTPLDGGAYFLAFMTFVVGFLVGLLR